MTFKERAPQMGLNTDLGYKGLYSYRDEYSEVIYRDVITELIINDRNPTHPTDGALIPVIAVFSRINEQGIYDYIGRVSNDYQFVGNGVLSERIRNSISDLSIGIFESYSVLTQDLARFRKDIVLSSRISVPEVGDVLPSIVIQNSYNGTKAASISYGISFLQNGERIFYAFKFGEMKMIHLASTSTIVREAVSHYMTVFRENITDVITTSFRTTVTEIQMFGVLDALEKIGKRKSQEIKGLLAELMEGMPEGSLPSSWQLFLAIIKYANLYPNLNVRRLLENMAESVLTIPLNMLEALKRLETV
jgi:hypothetical protein